MLLLPPTSAKSTLMVSPGSIWLNGPVASSATGSPDPGMSESPMMGCTVPEDMMA